MKEMLACLCDGMFKSRSDRIALAALVLFMLMMGTALRLNDHWAEQRQSVSPEIIGRWTATPALLHEIATRGTICRSKSPVWVMEAELMVVML